MKTIIFIFLIVLTLPSYAIEFYRCVDSNGKVHLTTLPISSLDASCNQKASPHAILLQEDYSNLQNEIDKFVAETSTSDEFSIGGMDFKIPHKGMFDADVAGDELIETASKRNDPITKHLRQGRKALESITRINSTDD